MASEAVAPSGDRRDRHLGDRPSDRWTWARVWSDYSLSIVVGVLFVGSFVFHAVFGWWQYAADQAAHGAMATLWGTDGYVVYFMEWTLQNWQSEFLEVLVLIVLTSFLIHKGSHESKDSQDKVQASLDRIERLLEQELAVNRDERQE